ncbi:Hypothetical_protein [Hexamita inflata]|uniref:Hypothetical_protein n=1 Tax=Hexamita inflata TaxID=28002 RepID=A0AA86T8T5_9EUKA|nr:Hypothetical protein HINF_LOCUS134 [Hexamita inflata]
MPTQQRPNRVLTESSADQFDLIRQLNFQKLVLASQFLFARYFLRLAREVVPLCFTSQIYIYNFVANQRSILKANFLYYQMLKLPFTVLIRQPQNLSTTNIIRNRANFTQIQKIILDQIGTFLT